MVDTPGAPRKDSVAAGEVIEVRLLSDYTSLCIDDGAVIIDNALKDTSPVPDTDGRARMVFQYPNNADVSEIRNGQLYSSTMQRRATRQIQRTQRRRRYVKLSPALLLKPIRDTIGPGGRPNGSAEGIYPLMAKYAIHYEGRRVFLQTFYREGKEKQKKRRRNVLRLDGFSDARGCGWGGGRGDEVGVARRFCTSFDSSLKRNRSNYRGAGYASDRAHTKQADSDRFPAKSQIYPPSRKKMHRRPTGEVLLAARPP